MKRLTPGRHSKFTPETRARILRCAEKGLPLALCAKAAGITYTTLCNYRNADPDFNVEVGEAIVRGVEKRLKKIEDASEAGDWRAAAWMLEHCLPEHFAKNRIEVTGADGSPLGASVAIFLPQKDDGTKPAIDVNQTKELENGNSGE